jgi:hypothetical protein
MAHNPGDSPSLQGVIIVKLRKFIKSNNFKNLLLAIYKRIAYAICSHVSAYCSGRGGSHELAGHGFESWPTCMMRVHRKGSTVVIACPSTSLLRRKKIGKIIDLHSYYYNPLLMIEQ